MQHLAARRGEGYADADFVGALPGQVCQSLNAGSAHWPMGASTSEGRELRITPFTSAVFAPIPRIADGAGPGIRGGMRQEAQRPPLKGPIC